MSLWTRYDKMNRTEMRKEVLKRKVKVYQNANTLQFRQALIQDDVKNGINPYHNNSSPSDDDNLLLQPNSLAEEPSVPTARQDFEYS